VYSIARTNDGFETTNLDARILRDLACGLHTLAKRMQRTVLLERIARRHQPPDAIELQPLEGEQADRAMGDMRRVEGAAEQPDAHALGIGRKRLRHGARYGGDDRQRPPRGDITAASVRGRERDT